MSELTNRMNTTIIIFITIISLTFFICSIATSTTTTTTTASSDSPSPTVYQVLESYDFPIGLLPKGITSYELDPDTGKFKVYLNKTCSFSIEGYDLKYKTTITGTISKDKIKDLSGIQVKVLFFWINIVEVTRYGDDLELSVGIASASFEVDNFEECPQCGCGFDCVNSIVTKTPTSSTTTSLRGLLGNLLEAAGA